jgi:hypothetical protein
VSGMTATEDLRAAVCEAVEVLSTDTKIVLPSDPEAATYRTDIRGWVSRTGGST